MIEFNDYKISELGKIGRGRSRHRPRNDEILYNGNYPFIQTSDVKKANLYITKHKATYNDFGLEQSKLWDKDTLCITIAANIADTALLNYPACFPDSIIGFEPYSDKSDVRFIKYYFDIYKKHMESISLGATQNNLSLAKLESLTFKVPSKKTQEKIANVLFTYDKLIENNNRRIEVLEQTAEEIYKEWFVRMRFPGYEKTKFDKGIPEGWEVKRVKNLGEVITGKTPSTKVAEYYGEEVMFIKTPDMYGNIFTSQTESYLSESGSNSQANKLLPHDSIMVSCIGTGGVVSINMFPAHTNQQINSIIIEDIKIREWAFFTLKSMKQTIELFGATGATMTNLSKGKFEGLKLLYPSDELLNKFNNITKPMFEELKSIILTNENLIKQRDLLLPRLMNGTIEVN
ncbi:restriction endonuclease subunit S [Macrococcus capreoli]|uniref:restriction endonuclease subunit S n=1 Tax=Macrococcus capreoli TaxID=2982690 RepID=UPI003EE5E0D9